MSAQILDSIDSIIVQEISNKMSPSELADCQAEVLRLLRESGGGSILCLCEDFEGFTSGDWSDLSFQSEADPLIRKMAIVGAKEVEDMALTFAAKGHRPFPIEYFSTGHLREAHAWLTS